ncbi:hypothetical protein BIFGAL_04446 [Bifidobacterium gallicum DSM 20093 = LMG 11596]|uniref:Uncharacterized protein n=1 Tax=Bifidobacterium gallicum DSM 20093 = LMG 11596 TaxID=561180 RepID=D1NX38_9BIFI|nr:hypothetical protein BIFGAL_04446 [Bifidobacterium gallicum DSM 20093 = LMG 11596]
MFLACVRAYAWAWGALACRGLVGREARGYDGCIEHLFELLVPMPGPVVGRVVGWPGKRHTRG